MIKKLISFKGRIGRIEYIISCLLYCILSFVVFPMPNESGTQTTMELFLAILNYPLLFLFLAQGAKRCHDKGWSGWWQLVPGCSILIMVSPGQKEENSYGCTCA